MFDKELTIVHTSMPIMGDIDTPKVRVTFSTPHDAVRACDGFASSSSVHDSPSVSMVRQEILYAALEGVNFVSDKEHHTRAPVPSGLDPSAPIISTSSEQNTSNAIREHAEVERRSSVEVASPESATSSTSDLARSPDARSGMSSPLSMNNMFRDVLRRYRVGKQSTTKSQRTEWGSRPLGASDATSKSSAVILQNAKSLIEAVKDSITEHELPEVEAIASTSLLIIKYCEVCARSALEHQSLHVNSQLHQEGRAGAERRIGAP